MKKRSAFMLVMLMLVVSACSTKNTEAPSETPQGSGDEPVTLTIAHKGILSADDPLLKAIEEGMKEEGKNVKLKFAQVQSGSYPEKLGLLLQSGEIPDLIYFQGGDYQFAITQKILEDLTPYIEKSTYVKAAMNPYNVERTKNYPYLVWASPTSNVIPAVRQDWLDKTASGKALLEKPTIDNYYQFLKEVKESNGAQFALTTAGNLDELDAIFGQAFGLRSTWIKGEDGQYVYSKTTAAEKEKLEFYAKLYKEGLLDPEFLTKKWDTKEKAFYDGIAAIVAANQGGSINLINQKMIAQNGAGSEITPLPPASGAAQGYTPVDASKESRGFAIAATSKHKDMAFAVLEYMTSPKGQVLDKLGIEGEQYVVENEKIKLTDKHAEWLPRFVESMENFKPPYEIDAATPYMSKPALDSLEMMASMSTKDNSFLIPDELAAKWDASLALYKEFAADMVTGKKTSADFDKFVQDWNAAGGKDLTEYANETIK
ncbi:extracellular solute-binding protein [Paenibacillus sp. GCM10027626]|uniref:extracellular solute-binding protein n=1 Tax=Paenibacillus sp. GCM10027626 TaxID=3273411 RepID=UPI00362EA7AD